MTTHNIQKSIKIKKDETFIPIQILNNIIQSTTVPEQTIDEEDSELFFTTIHGYGKIIFKNGNEYEGNVRYGIMHSLPNLPSNLKFKDGTVYKGSMVNNKITGKGQYTFPNNSIYIGELHDGLRHGFGSYESVPEEIFYEGNWNQGVKHGFGKLKIKGSQYEGSFNNGKKDGFGKLKWLDSGNYYEGELRDNYICGHGMMIWIDCFEKYIGQWKNNSRDGQGMHIWYELKGENKMLKNRYIGEWVNGKRNGYGTIFYSNGSKYEGYFYDNIKQGFGHFTFQDGSEYTGNFDNDRMIDDINKHSNSKDINITYPKTNSIRDNKTESYNTTNNLKLNKKKDDKQIETPQSTQGKVSEDNLFNSTTKSKLGSLSSKKALAPIESKNALKSGTKLYNLNMKVESIMENIIEEDEEVKVEKIDKNLAAATKSNASNPTNPVLALSNKASLAFEEIKNQEQKEPNTFLTLININDLLEQSNEDEKSINEIYNILLRHLSELKSWYKIYTNRDLIEKNSLNESRGDDSKSIRNTVGNKLSINKESSNTKEIIITEGLNINNDIGYCMEMRDFWWFLRDCGILSPELSLSDFDRLFFKGERNFVDYYIIQEDIDDNMTYDHLNSMISANKNNFIEKNKYYESKDKVTHTLPILTYTKGKIEFDIHSKRTIILARQFYECIVRLAFLKFNNQDESISKKLKNLIENYIKLNPKFKQKKLATTNQNASSMNSSILTNQNQQYIDEPIKVSSLDSIILDIIFQNFEHELFKIFTFLYKKFNSLKTTKKCDLTIKYIDIYSYILERKEEFINLITKHELTCHINKYHNYLTRFNFTSDNMYSNEAILYVSDLLNSDMVFFEFVELFALICKKYFQKNEYLESRDNFIKIINSVIDIFRTCEDITKITKQYSYSFPLLDYHKTLDIQIKDHLKRLEQERKIEQEKHRWFFENKKLKNYENHLLVVEFSDEEEEVDEEDD